MLRGWPDEGVGLGVSISSLDSGDAFGFGVGAEAVTIDGRQHGYEIAEESELRQLFPDCDEGAIPCLGDAFHMDVIVDNALLEAGMDVYIEGGDHHHLLHLSHKDFSRLMSNAWPAPISCLRGGQGDKSYLWAPPEDG